MKDVTCEFFFCTGYSIYRVRVRNADTSPEVMKMAVHDTVRPDGERLRNPVGGTLNTGHYFGISIKMTAKFFLSQPTKPLPPFGTKGLLVGSQTSSPLGFFLKQNGSCEDYFHGFGKSPEKIAFDERWQLETSAVLRMIGLHHPLISINTQGRHAIPAWAQADLLA